MNNAKKLGTASKEKQQENIIKLWSHRKSAAKFRSMSPWKNQRSPSFLGQSLILAAFFVLVVWGLVIVMRMREAKSPKNEAQEIKGSAEIQQDKNIQPNKSPDQKKKCETAMVVNVGPKCKTVIFGPDLCPVLLDTGKRAFIPYPVIGMKTKTCDNQ